MIASIHGLFKQISLMQQIFLRIKVSRMVRDPCLGKNKDVALNVGSTMRPTTLAVGTIQKNTVSK